MNARVILGQSCRLLACKSSSSGMLVENIQSDFASKLLSRGTWSFVPYRNIHGNSGMLSTARTKGNQNRKTGSISTTGDSTSDIAQVENRKIIAKLLAIQEEDVRRVPFKMISEDKAQHTLDVLRSFGFTPSSIHLYPELLLMGGGAVENYIRIMQETGFPEVKEMFILRFRTVCKQSLTVLQQKVSVSNVNIIVERYCAELEEGSQFLNDFIRKLPKDTGKMTLFDLRNVMMGRYLGKLLLGSLDESMLKFSKYPRMYYRSFNWIKRNYRILRDFGFSKEKIKSHAYLLHTDPNNLNRVTKINSLAGLDIKVIGNLRPKIFMSTYDSLIDIENSLIKHQIPFESVHKYPEVFTLSATTIRQRLQEIDTIPEFQLLKTHPRVARLLYYQNKAKSRLDEFRNSQMRGPSLHLLSSDTKRFNKSVSSGDFRVRGVDVTLFLSEVLKVDKQCVRDSVVRHPHWLHVPLVNIKSVLKFLLSAGNFSSKQLIDAIPILLYPKEKVEEQMEKVLISGDAKLDDDYFLQMVLYYLERPVHFTGDAVWPEKTIHQEYDDEDGNSQKSAHMNKAE